VYRLSVNLRRANLYAFQHVVFFRKVEMKHQLVHPFFWMDELISRQNYLIDPKFLLF